LRGNRSRTFFATFSALLLMTSLAAAKTKKAVHKHAAAAHKSAQHSRHSRSRHSKKMAWKYRGQRRPDAERTRAIQEALRRQNYLHGQPSGVWDQMTRDAMARFQEDHGWQTKMVPDSRALIALGLGPSKDGLINPETAMTSAPPDTGAADRDSATAASFRQ